MPASPFASAPAAHARLASQAYRQVAVDSQVNGGADGHRLVGMLFDGFFEAASQARGALRRGDAPAKGQAIARASAIVEEGLRAALDVERGGAIARDLNDLYAYVASRLARANLASDEAALEECVRLLRPVAEAWSAIRPAHAAAA